jgi:hypothetical protein
MSDALNRTSISEIFDLTTSPVADDELVDANEIGLEIRFPWRGKWRHELHRWPLTWKHLSGKTLVDVGDELIPPLRFDGDPA